MFKNIILTKKNLKNRKFNLKKNLLINFKRKIFKIFKIINNLKKINKNIKNIFIKKLLIIKNNYLKILKFKFKKIIIKIPNKIHFTTNFLKNFKIIKKKIFKKPKKIINHLEISKKLGLDLLSGERISGKGFSVIKNPLSSLYRSIISLMLEIHKKENNYKEYIIPYLIKQKRLIESSHIPKFEKKLFKLSFKKKIYLIPTSEVVLINININYLKNLPIKIVCYSSCFRNESNFYGKKKKGLIKQKQFEKIELINITDNKNSFKYLNELIKFSEKILIYLKLNYRIILIKNFKTGISSSKTYDLEVFLPSIKNYLEVSSCSNTKDYQSKKIKIKYNKDNKKYVNIINGTGLSVGRILVSILENKQKKNKIIIPKILRKFLENKKFIKF